MTERPRALVFGEDADSYDRFRPSYPLAAIDHMLGLLEVKRAVEVGAGTGKATIDVARPELDLVCLEPSPEMAHVLDAKRLPGVRVIESSIEDWDGPANSVDLMYAAQSWHWVDRAVAYDKARRVLRSNGALALIWNIPLDRYSPFSEIYAAHAPHLLVEQDDRVRRRDDHDWLEDLEAAGFTALERFTHQWSTRLSAAEHRSLYSTYSDHMMLPEPSRSLLLEGLEAVIHERGGFSTLQYRTEVFSGRA